MLVAGKAGRNGRKEWQELSSSPAPHLGQVTSQSGPQLVLSKTKGLDCDAASGCLPTLAFSGQYPIPGEMLGLG